MLLQKPDTSTRHCALSAEYSVQIILMIFKRNNELLQSKTILSSTRSIQL